MRFCQQVIDGYPEPQRSRLLDVLDSWDDKLLAKEFYESLNVVEHAGGYQVDYRLSSLFDPSYKATLFSYSEHLFTDAEQQLTQTDVKFLEYTPKSLPSRDTSSASAALGL